MNLYTCIVEFKGGTFISQHRASDLMTAFYAWADYFSKEPYVSKMQSKQLLEDVKNEDFYPSEISEVINVWCWTSVIWGKFILLNIVKTVE
mgnify:FL=1